jgi:DNA-directed RNA polymerase subunit alpha
MKVITDGSITPDYAVKKASSLLVDQFSKISGDVHVVSSDIDSGSIESSLVASADEEMCDKLMKDIDHLELTVRSHNCLKSAGATTVWALVQMNPNDLLKLANFGRKSLNEINEVLDKMGLSLGMHIPDSVFKLMSDRVSSATSSSIKS